MGDNYLDHVTKPNKSNKWDDYYWYGYYPKPWSIFDLDYKQLEKPKEDTIERFTVEYLTDSMVLRGNLPGFAKTQVNVFLEDGKLNVVTTGGKIKYSVNCPNQIYDWKRITTSYYEGYLVVEVKKPVKISDRVDIKL